MVLYFRLWRSAALVLFAVLLATPSLSQSPGSATVALEDSITGAGVVGQVVVTPRAIPSTVNTFATDASGRVTFTGDGVYDIDVSVPGYAPLSTHIGLARSEPGDFTILLRPLHDPRVRAPISSTEAVFDGYIIDKATKRPIKDAKVTSRTRSTSVTTDSNGYFSIAVPGSPVNEPFALEALSIEKQGYKNHVIEQLWRIPGRTGLRLKLESGTGRTETRIPHRDLAAKGQDDDADKLNVSPLAARAPAPSGAAPDGREAPTSLMEPPQSIRVGVDCGSSKRRCQRVVILPFEQYVETGLGREWNPGWDLESLKSGAVAYRTYAAHFVADPIVPRRYDICSNTNCQAWSEIVSPDPTDPNAAQVVLAAVLTSGFMLAESGSSSPALSEYSRENNDPSSSCGDCFCGFERGATKWSCLFDPVGCGQPLCATDANGQLVLDAAGNPICGHGRGMSQRGSQRWATGATIADQFEKPNAQLWSGQSWVWVLNHYYNERPTPKYFLTSPISATGSLPSMPVTRNIGETFGAALTVRSTTSGRHTNVIASTSLRSSQRVIESPLRLISVDPGLNEHPMTIQIPASAAPGIYDLVFRLWFDVNGDGLINDPANDANYTDPRSPHRSDLLIGEHVLTGAVVAMDPTSVDPRLTLVSATCVPFVGGQFTFDIGGPVSSTFGYSICPTINTCGDWSMTFNGTCNICQRQSAEQSPTTTASFTTNFVGTSFFAALNACGAGPVTTQCFITRTLPNPCQ